MSDNPWFWLTIGVVAVVVVMIGILIWDRRVPSDDAINNETESAYWQEQVDALQQDFGLEKTRAAAGKWAATAASILGILSTVAIVAGPSNLVDDVGGSAATTAAVLVLVAGGLAAIATLLAGTAEQGTPISGRLTPGGLRALLRTRATRAATQIRWSRILTVLALVLIFAATGIAWLKPLTAEEKPTTSTAIVVDKSGARCGILATTSAGGLSVKVNGLAEPISTEAEITLVESCP